MPFLCDFLSKTFYCLYRASFHWFYCARPSWRDFFLSFQYYHHVSWIILKHKVELVALLSLSLAISPSLYSFKDERFACVCTLCSKPYDCSVLGDQSQICPNPGQVRIDAVIENGQFVGGCNCACDPALYDRNSPRYCPEPNLVNFDSRTLQGDCSCACDPTAAIDPTSCTFPTTYDPSICGCGCPSWGMLIRYIYIRCFPSLSIAHHIGDHIGNITFKITNQWLAILIWIMKAPKPQSCRAPTEFVPELLSRGTSP